MTDEKLYWLGFSLVPLIGPVRFSQLETHFKTLEEAWKAHPGELRRAGLDDSVIKAVTDVRTRVELDKEVERLESLEYKCSPGMMLTTQLA